MRELSQLPLGFAEEHCSAGDHIAYFWETDQEFSRGVLFLDAGLQRDEAAVVFGHAAGNARVLAELRALGHDPAVLIGTHRLSILEGKPQRTDMMQEIGGTFTSMMKAGAKMIRLLGNIGWGHEDWPDDDEIFHFEAEVTDAARQFPCVVVCMYNVAAVSGAVILHGAFQTHPITCCAGQVLRNPHFVPLPEYLKRLRPMEPTTVPRIA